MKKSTFYLLSFTWGLPMTLIGCLVALFLMLLGCKPKRWGYCWYFEIGDNWGGVELGAVFIVNRNPSVHIMNHEYGHGIQNCYFGLLMPFLICVPSAIRYWYRQIIIKIRPDVKLPPYDSIWFEDQATRLGSNLINNIKKS